MGEVQAKLGEPVAEFVSGSEGALTYGTWRLIFLEDKLVRRFHELHRKAIDLNQPPSVYDDEVESLRRGISSGAAEQRLGVPQVREMLFERHHHPVEILRYGRWELQFEDGRLTVRTRN
jgi:hypothetical protein